MPTLDRHQSQERSRILLVGNNGTGKTGALAALAEAGYELFIEDFDNGLDSLIAFTSDEAKKRIHFETLRDTVEFGESGPMVRHPWAAKRGEQLMYKWVDSETKEDYGGIYNWGPEKVLVIDSATYQGKAILNQVLKARNRIGKPKRIQDWGEAIERQEAIFDKICDDSVKCNVIVTAHLSQLGDSGEDDDDEEEGGSKNGQTDHRRYPTVLGKKLPPRVGSYFNIVVQSDQRGSGGAVQRFIRTAPQPDVDVKVPVSSNRLKRELSVDQALPEIFNVLQGRK